MAYTTEVSRNNPSCFLFLLDQSGSMNESIWNKKETKTKAEGVARVLNRLLKNIIVKCAKSDGIRDYYHIAVIGYGEEIQSALGGHISGKEWLPLSEIANYPLQIEERVEKVMVSRNEYVNKKVKVPIWVQPVASGGTPMCGVFSYAYDILTQWVEHHPHCFPPIVINITDGESTDGDPAGEVEKVKSLKTSDGNVLIFNIHLSSQPSSSIVYPDSETDLPDKYAQQLFRMSSKLPHYMIEMAKQEGMAISEESRGFGFNANLMTLVNFLEIGTRPGNLF